MKIYIQKKKLHQGYVLSADSMKCMLFGVVGFVIQYTF